MSTPLPARHTEARNPADLGRGGQEGRSQGSTQPLPSLGRAQAASQRQDPHTTEKPRPVPPLQAAAKQATPVAEPPAASSVPG